MSEEQERPQLGETGEHPLSVLLFSWMRTKLFAQVMLIGLAAVGVMLIGFEIVLALKPIKGVTDVPGFYGVVGFLAFGIAVLMGWPLGKLLRRPEDYYDKRSGEAGRDR